MAAPQQPINLEPLNLGGQAFDITSAISGQLGKSDLMPSGINDALTALRTQASNTMGEGSFAAKRPILSTILSALGTAAIGGIAGGMDSNVGAGRGALLGALTGGLSAPLLERQRKNNLGKLYMEQANNVLANQKTLEEFRKNRSGAKLGSNIAQRTGYDAGIFQDANGDFIPLSDTLAATEIGAMRAQPSLDVLGDYAQQAGITGQQRGEAINQASQGLPAPQQGVGSIPAALQAPAGLETDPSVVAQALAQNQPLQGGVVERGIPPLGSQGVAMIDPELAKTGLAQAGQNYRYAMGEATEAPRVLAQALANQANAKATLEKLPAEVQLLIAQAINSKAQAGNASARARLADRTDPNIRGGGSRSQENPIDDIVKAIATSANASDDTKAMANAYIKNLFKDAGMVTTTTPAEAKSGGSFDWLKGLIETDGFN